MKSAAPKTYISKRMMDQYKEQRQSRISQTQQPKQPQVVKKFAEDEEEKKLEVVQEQPQAQAMSAAATVQVEETIAKKTSFFSKLGSLFSSSKADGADKGPSTSLVMNRSASLDMDRNLSCEEMDSDDLGGGLNLSD